MGWPSKPPKLCFGMPTNTDTEAGREATARDTYGLGAQDLLDFYRLMVTARRVDDREISLKRQNKIFFQISGAGHEAIQVALARHCRSAHDWFYFYYRDRAFTLALGQTPLDHLLQAVAAEDDPSSGGRQMPAHYGDPRYNIVSTSSPTGTQFLQAVGTAEAAWRATLLPGLQEHVKGFQEDEIVVVTTGDGTTSEGEFWEALNSASNLKLPVLFLVEDNGYAISVPVEVNTAGGKISNLVTGFPDLFIRECDGTDVLDSYAAAGEAVDWVRSRKGPALLHAHTVRPYSHSMSDDERMYRLESERDADAQRDPLTRTRALLMELGMATGEELDALEAEVEQAVAQAADDALTHPQPHPDTATRHLYCEDVDPTGADFDTEDSPQYPEEERLLTTVDLLNACLKDEMERDERIVVFGEDVADASRESALGEVKGKGGVFKVTHGLQQRFGGERVFNSPLAEANIVGRAVGMALRGLKPVVEIQFFDYIWPAFHQIRNELATMRYRSNNGFAAPVVIRVTYGGYLKGGAIYHSQTGASLFTHTPGLRVVLPSNAEDANGLLRTAIRSEDPVLFLEHKHLYRQIYNKGRYPGPDYMIPFGKAKVVREGSDVTVVTCGALVKRSLDAAKQAADQHGVEAEVIDLRTLSPLDMDTVAESVKKTNKVVVVHEDALSFGIGAEIAARIADDLFPWLDGPVRRVASMDTWVAYAPQLEEVILPQTRDVLETVLELARF
jgi:2-oxoisovalerate dehydrogenase E1 component